MSSRLKNPFAGLFGCFKSQANDKLKLDDVMNQINKHHNKGNEDVKHEGGIKPQADLGGPDLNDLKYRIDTLLRSPTPDPDPDPDPDPTVQLLGELKTGVADALAKEGYVGQAAVVQKDAPDQASGSNDQDVASVAGEAVDDTESAETDSINKYV